MSTVTKKIDLILNGYVPGTNTIALDPETGEKLIDWRPGGQQNFSTAIALGNGVFFTAAHSFDTLIQSGRGDKPIVEFKAQSASIDAQDFKWNNVRDWHPILNATVSTQLNDLAVGTSAAAISNSDLNPFMIFDTINSYNNVMNSRQVTFYGQITTTGASGQSASLVDGQFTANMDLQDGDSGGMTITHIGSGGGGPDYVNGILSSSGGGYSTFSYIRPSEFYAAIHKAEGGSDNSYANMAPDLIFSDRVGGYLRGTGRRADIITHGNDETIVAENGGELINSGSGTNTVVALAATAHDNGQGTTFVVSPGDETISGAGKNDRLVALADRLWTSEHGNPTLANLSYKSDTIQITGGIGHDNGDQVYAAYAPYYIYSGAAVAQHDAYNVAYNLQHGSDGDTLRIYFQANDKSSALTDMGYKTLWSSSITVLNFHDGDLGIHLTYDNDWGGYGTDAYQSAFLSAANLYTASAVSSSVVNDDPNDVWNGKFSSSIYGDLNVGDVDARIEQNRLDYGGVAQKGQNLFGTDSDDILTGSLGNDVIRGGAGNDTLIGRSGDDTLIGGAGNDQLDGGPGNNILIGGAGDDTAIFSGRSGDYPLTFQVTQDGIAEFLLAPAGASPGTGDHLRSAEHVKFSDTTIDVVLPHNVADFGSVVSDIGSAAGRVYSLYEGLFDRAPTALELEQHTADVPSTLWLQGVIGQVMATAEYQNAAGSLGNSDFTKYLYEHMLHRNDDSGGLAYYSGRLDQGESRAEIIEELTYSPEHKSLLQDTFDSGIFLVDRNPADVARLYYTSFNRAPDEGGLKYFTSRVVGGESVSDIANLLVSSDEWHGNFGQLTDSQFIDTIILRSDGRHATSAELSNYGTQLQNWQTRADLLYQTAVSPEAQHWHAAEIESGWVVT